MVNDAATTLGVKDTQRKPVLAMSHPVILTTIASSLGFLSPSRREPWKSADCPIRQSRPLAVPGWHDEASSVIQGKSARLSRRGQLQACRAARDSARIRGACLCSSQSHPGCYSQHVVRSRLNEKAAVGPDMLDGNGDGELWSNLPAEGLHWGGRLVSSWKPEQGQSYHMGALRG